MGLSFYSSRLLTRNSSGTRRTAWSWGSAAQRERTTACGFRSKHRYLFIDLWTSTARTEDIFDRVCTSDKFFKCLVAFWANKFKKWHKNLLV